jgi:hypothetical protein
MIQLGWISYTEAKRYVNVQTNKKNAPFGSKVVRRYFYVILLQSLLIQKLTLLPCHF